MTLMDTKMFPFTVMLLEVTPSLSLNQRTGLLIMANLYGRCIFMNIQLI